jgi:limonene-1,2-epoxide hydrolase
LQGTAEAGQSRFVLHDTTDADVFITELDTVPDRPGGQREPVSLVQIFRIRDGRIAVLRDYFTV